MPVAIFNKKSTSIIIEAIQWDGNSNKAEIDAFVGRTLRTELESEIAYLGGKGFPVFSLILNENTKVYKGDWIIKDNLLSGDVIFYPYKDELFQENFETVEHHFDDNEEDFYPLGSYDSYPFNIKIKCPSCGKKSNVINYGISYDLITSVVGKDIIKTEFRCRCCLTEFVLGFSKLSNHIN